MNYPVRYTMYNYSSRRTCNNNDSVVLLIHHLLLPPPRPLPVTQQTNQGPDQHGAAPLQTNQPIRVEYEAV